MDNDDKDDDDIESLSDIEQEVLEVTIAIKMHEKQKRSIKRQCYSGQLTGIEFVQELIHGHPDRMYNMFRMDASVFMRLCDTLEHFNFLADDRHVCVIEAVAMALYILSHGVVIRVVAERFQRSIDTVFTHFKRVLKALCCLAPMLIKSKSQGPVPPEITDNPKFMPYFEKCIGAIDGTHIAAWSPAQKQTSYRDRKAQVTQNIMCACSFDMMFTFIYTGWEGTANDSRVFMDALNRQEVGFPFPEEGYYYVVDSGYINMKGFMTPYRGQRYHLRDYRGQGRAPTGLQELFNYRHSSLRNVIERCFGVLKARFSILKNAHNYSLRKQRLIPIACCVLHNFIRQEAARDKMFEDFNVQELIIEEDETNRPLTNIDLSSSSVSEMSMLRDTIATSMWHDQQT